MRLRSLVALACAMVVGASTSSAMAVDKKQCVASYEKAQELRASGALGAAREQLLVCADPSCPKASQVDCTTWLAEVDGAMPSLLLVVTDASGQDLTDVEVTLDGKPFVSRIDGKAVPVDPGPHELTFTAPDSEPLKKSVVVREGEKSRRVEVSLGKMASSQEPKPEETSGGGAIHPATWVLGGVGVAGIGLFGVMAGLGVAEKADAKDTCAPRCTDETVESIETKFLVGDVALLIGGVSLVAAVIVGVVSATSGGGEPASAARLEIVGGPLPGGGFLGIAGTL
ncbi:MAG: hypothetical protein IPM79_09930 [Polyangiaceae bacterium]|nr:hypothetical protein [Polyangiaceae bacterium]MBK8937941.1 hypothetical protein [Polyangiaceae bacterium]